MEEIKFKACLHKVTIDKEGESTVILKIPLSDLVGIIKLTTKTEKLLDVGISEAEENG